MLGNTEAEGGGRGARWSLRQCYQSDLDGSDNEPDGWSGPGPGPLALLASSWSTHS